MDHKSEDKQPHTIIIKRVKKVYNKHHGGSWKIAYADFVTAMMAFFLLMWLLSMLNKYQLQGISRYFKKPLSQVFNKQDDVARTQLLKPDTLGPTSQANTGAKNKTINKDQNAGSQAKQGNAAGQQQEQSQNQTQPQAQAQAQTQTQAQTQPQTQSTSQQQAQAVQPGHAENEGQTQNQLQSQTQGQAQIQGQQQVQGQAKIQGQQQVQGQSATQGNQQMQANAQQAQNLTPQQKQLTQEYNKNPMQEVKDIKADLEAKLKNDPEINQYKNHLNFIVTADGLKIVIKDLEGKPMFSEGRTDFQKYASDIITWLGQQINNYPNQIEVIGHTDTIPYMDAEIYSNWELSADRANATRRVLIKSGMNENKVLRIVGGADTDLIKNEPGNDPSNRRIEIIVLTDQAAKQIQNQ